MGTPRTGDGVARVALLAVAVLALDMLTKILLPTPAWALHEHTRQWQFTALACVIVFALLTVSRPLALGAALMLAGTLANLLDSLDGTVANPYVRDFGHGNVAFNSADVALYAGGVALWCSLVLMMSRSLRARRLA